MMADSSIYGSTRELMTATDSVEKASVETCFKRRSVLSRQRSSASFDMGSKKIDQVLTPEEKRFLLFVERGDCASVAKTIKTYKSKPYLFDINCTDPLGRSALSITIINENPEMMELLLEEGIQVKDALLLAISEEYVEGVELLLQYEERTHEPGQPYSWEGVDNVSANYTPDITPLILAAHKNNYEILKILLDRGASLPTPHDLKCSCEACITASQEDSLRFSLSRINAYKALASPSLISLTSSDPILTAFQLSDELKKLKHAESQFCAEFSDLRRQVQGFAMSLLDHARTSYELEIMLNYDLHGDIWDPGETQTLQRLKLALKCKQKAFVAHPNVQQLLASIWYEGLPGWRRMNIISQTLELVRLGLMFPIYSIAYMIAPNSSSGHFMKNPFVKFICQSASFLCFLMLLACASQRLEKITMQFVGETFEIPYLLELVQEWHEKERGSFPTPIECMIIIWVFSIMWKEVKEVYEVGFREYIKDMWNLADIFTNTCFVGWIFLRMAAWVIVKREEAAGINPYYPREQWHAYDPFLISEGLFGAGMISSYLKLVHIFSINPHLGPLQISLGRMALDIMKWLSLYILVLFAFGCGMNQLLWYYADLEYEKCYSLPGGLPNLKGEVPAFKAKSNACIVWRRFANLFETSQSLFWASFGLVSLMDFELTGIKEFTRFWALLMFGSYSVCNLIVLLNMLIAMMSNSFQIISEKSDTEWKFARTKLWISYFETGSTVPPPFNIIPTIKSFCRLVGCNKKPEPDKNKEREVAEKRYRDVMKCIIRRYITAEQKKTEEFSITEDDVSEIRQDINKFRYELIDILRNNNFNTPEIRISDVYVSNKRAKQTQRRILKGFNINTVDGALREAFAKDDAKTKDFFKVVAKAISSKDKYAKRSPPSSGDGSVGVDHIGSNKTFQERRMASFRRTILARGGSEDELNTLTASELVNYNPLLKNYTPTTRLAYAKFKSFALRAKDTSITEEKATVEDETTGNSATKKIKSMSRIHSLVEKSSLAGSLRGSLNDLSVKEDQEEDQSPQKVNTAVQQKLAEDGLIAKLEPKLQDKEDKADQAAELQEQEETKISDNKLIEFSPDQSMVGQGMDEKLIAATPVKSDHQSITNLEKAVKEPENEAIKLSAENITEKALPEKPSEMIITVSSLKVSPPPRTQQVKHLMKQFSQDQAEPPPETAKSLPKKKKGSRGAAPSPPTAAKAVTPKRGKKSPKKKTPEKLASATSLLQENTAVKSSNGSPKIFPSSSNEAGRNEMGIQSPMASPLMKADPPSPLPPKNVPLSMDSMIPFVDEPEPPSAVGPSAGDNVKASPAGKSVITGQVRTGWL